MKIAFKVLVLSLVALLIVCTSCSKDDPEEVTIPTDYREAFVGVYDGTKSNMVFVDMPFIVNVVVTIEIDSTTLTSLKINDYSIPVDDDGVFGPDYHNGQYYDLMIKGDSLSLYINEPMGSAIPCFIEGVKRD